MDVMRIVDSNGYRIEDMTEEHREIIRWLRYLVDDMKAWADGEYAHDDGGTLHQSLYNSIASEVAEELHEIALSTVAEYQISLRDSEQDDDEA